MQVEMEVFRAEAVGKITLIAETVEEAKAKAIEMAKAHELPLKPVKDELVVRAIRVIE